MDWTTDQVGNNQRDARLSDEVELLVVPDGEAKEIRLIGPARRVARHWLPINKKNGGTTRIPRVCLAFNDATGKFDRTTVNDEGVEALVKCPFCAIDPKSPGIEVHQNAIDRDAQAAEPSKKTKPTADEQQTRTLKGFKCRVKSSKASRTWTPVRLAVMSGGHTNHIKDLVGMNKHKVRDDNGDVSTKLFGPEDLKRGFDVALLYNSKRAQAQKYSVVRGDNTEITPEERRYLMWDINKEQPKPYAEAVQDAKELKRILHIEGEEPAGDEDEPPAKNKRAPAKAATIDDDEDWEADDAPAAKPAAKRRPAPEPEDDDEFDEPVARPAKRRPVAEPADDFDDEPVARPAKRRPVAEPEDDEFDDAPPARTAKPAPRRRPVVEPEDDFDDEPPARAAKPAAKRRPVAEPDDDDFDDEPAARPAKRRPAVQEEDAPVPRKKRPVAAPEPEGDFDEDDEDGDGWDD